MRLRVGIAAATALLLAGCSGQGGAGGARTGGEPGTMHVVVIGDSLIDPRNGCPQGCTGFAEQFAHHVASRVSGKVDYHLVTAMGLPEAVEVVTKPGPQAKAIAAADVVVVEVGFNNALPDPDTGIGCKTWFLDTEPTCLAEGVKTYGALYDRVFAGVKALRKGEPTVAVATTSIDANINPADRFPDGLLALDADRTAELKAWAVAAYDRWNVMLTARAKAAGFQVVDLYHAFNGPDGTRADYPRFTDDGSHPNAAGNDLIASELTKVDLSAIDR